MFSKMFHNPSSVYISERVSSSKLHPLNKFSFKRVISIFLAMTFLLSFANLSLGASTAHADPLSDAKKTLDKVLGSEPGGSLSDFVHTALQDKNTNQNSSPLYVVQRIFLPGYINDTPDAYDRTSGAKVNDTYSGGRHFYNCNVNDPRRNTPLYHNCDVPNFITELIQNYFSRMMPSGVQGATMSNSHVDFGFGIPSNIPGDGKVPLKTSNRPVKYTALELYGYNLKYTSYYGEWDHIQTLTAARALANFSFVDSLKLTGMVINDAVNSAATASAKASLDRLKKGDLLGAMVDGYVGFVSAGASQTVNSIIDTSDHNVFTSNAWYRLDYGNTLYHARELNNFEIQAFIQSLAIGLAANNGDPLSAVLPEDFKKIQNPPELPKNDISKCVAHDSSGAAHVLPEVALSTAESNGGLNESECKDLAKAKYNDSNPEWTVDGVQKKQLITDWVKDNQATFDTAKKYNINCVDTEEKNRDKTLQNFDSCWKTAWNNKQTSLMTSIQGTNDQNWVNKTLSQDSINRYLSDKGINFNSPEGRLICLNDDGTDMKDGYSWVYLYDRNGVKNPKCGAVRPPIQNGLFGNGYDSKNGADLTQTAPLPDTRYSMLPFRGIGSALGSPTAMFGMDVNNISNVFLDIAKFTTKISVTLIDLSFAPILSKLGILPTLITLVSTFRDSIFLPFIVLIIAVSALQVFFTTVRNRSYQQGLISLLLICGVAMLGTFVLHDPQKVFNLVDNVPSQVETTIVGSVYSIADANEDNLCTATATDTASVSAGTDLNGAPLPFSPSSASRSMECEVWRVFVFDPYIQGQWGTTYKNLNSSGATNSDHITNKNSDLVGTPTVNMGGQRVINNWGLYQVDVLSNGTSTTEGNNYLNGQVPRDFYKLVDVQAGPDNGAQSDGKYLSSWAGKDPGNRIISSLLAAVVSIIGLITIFGFAMFKIEITLLSAFMLLLLPFMFLVGIHPTFGRGQFKKYIGTLISLMIQRVFIVFILVILLKTLVNITEASHNIILASGIAIVICLTMNAYRKEILGLVSNSVGAKTGGVMNSSLTNNPHGTIMSIMPRSIQNMGYEWGNAAKAGAAGAVGGFIAGGVRGATKGVTDAGRREFNVREHRLARMGKLTAFNEGSRAFAAGKKAAESNPRLNKQKLPVNISEGMREERIARENELLNKEATEIQEAHNKEVEKHLKEAKTNNSTVDFNDPKNQRMSWEAARQKARENSRDKATGKTRMERYANKDIAIDMKNPLNRKDIESVEILEKKINDKMKARDDSIKDIEKPQAPDFAAIDKNLDENEKKLKAEEMLEKNQIAMAKYIDATNERTKKYNEEIAVLKAQQDLYIKRLADRNDEEIDHINKENSYSDVYALEENALDNNRKTSFGERLERQQYNLQQARIKREQSRETFRNIRREESNRAALTASAKKIEKQNGSYRGALEKNSERTRKLNSRKPSSPKPPTPKEQNNDE